MKQQEQYIDEVETFNEPKKPFPVGWLSFGLGVATGLIVLMFSLYVLPTLIR